MSKQDKIEAANLKKDLDDYFLNQYSILCRQHGMFITTDIYGRPTLDGGEVEHHLQELKEFN